MKLVKLTGLEGRPVYLSPDAVVMVVTTGLSGQGGPPPGTTAVFCTHGMAIHVRETPDDVYAKLTGFKVAA